MSTQSAVAESPAIINGLDVNAALATIAAIKADKSLAKFQFRARNTWINGGENRSVIRDFYGAGREDTSRSASFEFTNGEPPVLLGNTRAQTRSNSCCMPLLAASRLLLCCMPWRAGLSSRNCRQSSPATSTCKACSGSTTPCRPATSRSAFVCTSRRTARTRTSRTYSRSSAAFASVQHNMPACPGGNRPRHWMI